MNSDEKSKKKTKFSNCTAILVIIQIVEGKNVSPVKVYTFFDKKHCLSNLLFTTVCYFFFKLRANYYYY